MQFVFFLLSFLQSFLSALELQDLEAMSRCWITQSLLLFRRKTTFVVQPHISCLTFILVFTCREKVVQDKADPISIYLDEVKAEQILSLTNNVLLLISLQTPVIRKLMKSCQFYNYFYCILMVIYVYVYLYISLSISLYICI